MMTMNLPPIAKIVLPLGLLGALGLASISATSAPSPGSEFTYETATVSVGSVRKRVQTSGTVRPLVTVLVGSQLSGQIENVNVDFNANVKEGEVLATLDDKTFRAKVEQSAADLATAEASLKSQRATLEKAKAARELADKTKLRLSTLSDKGISSLSQSETATRDAAIAAAEISYTEAQIEVAKSAVENRKAALKQAEIDLSRTQIRAPMDGTVISRTVEVGQTVAASLSAPELFRIAQDLKKIIIEAQVGEADIGGISEGNPVTFRVDAYRDREFKGEVSQVRLAGTEERGVVSYTVVITAANEDMKLYPAMTATIDIELDKRANVVRLPAEALRYKPIGTAKADESADDKASRRAEKIAELRDVLKLGDDQERLAKAALEALGKDEDAYRAAKASGQEVGKKKFSSTDAIETALKPSLTEEQARAFEAWKSGRSATKLMDVWVLSANGEPERRRVRVGLIDNKHAELVTPDTLGKDERLIIRSRFMAEGDAQ